MTREEAIHELQEDKRLYETDLCHAGDGSPDGQLLEALDMAIEALQREEAEEKGYCHRIIPSNVEVVVRCKDCRHGQYDATHYFCAEHYHKVYEDGYCSHGERRCNYFGERREP